MGADAPKWQELRLGMFTVKVKGIRCCSLAFWVGKPYLFKFIRFSRYWPALHFTNNTFRTQWPLMGARMMTSVPRYSTGIQQLHSALWSTTF